MAERSTWEEASEPPAELVPVLTFVLRYGDLLAERHAFVPIEARDAFTIGRSRGAHEDLVTTDEGLALDDGWASSRHAILRRKEGGTFSLEDGNSRNGTYLNGERISGKQRLFDGDLIEIGHTLLCFRHVERTCLDSFAANGLPRFGPTTTRCPEASALMHDLERIARSRQSILLLGETGVGKEVLARAVHELSGRHGAFCAIDCGAVPETLFEATFFGHRRGAFTGAAEARAGEIARADQGTLLLDEVGNMTPACQAKLLRAIEESTIVPLGGAEPLPVDVRWIAATNADPFARSATLRPDLVQRLAGFVARIPPLRRRRDDLGALAAHALREGGVARASISAAAGRRLFADPFPGNVRQLRAALQSAAILAGSGTIEPSHLPVRTAASDATAERDASVERPTAAPSSSGPTAPTGPPDAAAIDAVLTRTGGNVIRAAALLDARPRQLYRWIEKLAIPLDRYRVAPRKGSSAR